MTKQQIFNKVAKHLLMQHKKAKRNGKCVYRGPNGLKCAIGCLIPDKLYKPDMENTSIHYIFSSYEEVNNLFHQINDIIFLEELQKIHDFSHANNWRNELKSFAQINNLKFNV